MGRVERRAKRRERVAQIVAWAKEDYEDGDDAVDLKIKLLKRIDAESGIDRGAFIELLIAILPLILRMFLL